MSKGTFLRRSCQDQSFQRRPWLLWAPFPSATCLPSQTVLHNQLSKQRPGPVPFLSQPCPTETNRSKPGAAGLERRELVAGVCWAEQRLLGNGWASSGHQRGGVVGAGKGSSDQPWDPPEGSSELGSRDLQTRERLRDLQGWEGSDKFQPTTHCLDGETEAQGKKGSWPEQHSQLLPASSTDPSARASELLLGGHWARNTECCGTRSRAEEPGSCTESSQEREGPAESSPAPLSALRAFPAPGSPLAAVSALTLPLRGGFSAALSTMSLETGTLPDSARILVKAG